MVKPISPAPFSAAVIGFRLFDVARDVLDYHDGVIDHKAGGDGQRHQRQVIDRKAKEIHGGKGADQRQRHRDRRNDRGRTLRRNR